jgi:hypothetical protein
MSRATDTNNEWIAIGRERGDGRDIGARPRVRRGAGPIHGPRPESRPVVVDGRVLHRLRLDQVRWTDDGASDDGVARD